MSATTPKLSSPSKFGSEPCCWTCKAPWSILRRRHHCRVCSKAFCDIHSQHRMILTGFATPQRLCDDCCCIKSLPLPRQTRAFCGRCTLMDRRGPLFWPATWIVDDNRIWLNTNCDIHGTQRTLMCSNILLYSRATLMDAVKEDVSLCDRRYIPTILDMSIMTSDGNFKTEEQLGMEILNVSKSDIHCVLRVFVGPAMDIQQLNHRLLSLSSALPSNITLAIASSYERLLLLARQQQSIFDDPRSYPLLRLFVCPAAVAELSQCLNGLLDKYPKGLRMGVILLLDRFQLPSREDLAPIISILRSHPRLVRLVIFEIERAGRSLAAKLATRKSFDIPSNIVANKDELIAGSVDIVPVLDVISKSCEGEFLSMDDFVPASTGVALTPFLELLGYGRYSIQPAPLNAFAAITVNGGESLGRVLDFQTLWRHLLPLVSNVRSIYDMGLSDARLLGDAISASLRYGRRPFDIAKFIHTSPEKLDEILLQCQIWIVDNKQDDCCREFQLETRPMTQCLMGGITVDNVDMAFSKLPKKKK